MRHDEERDNTTAIEATIIEADNATWSECKCEACNSDEHNDGANGYENHQGDGPSGFDYYQDTKWCC